MNSSIWLTPNYGIHKDSTWTENESFVLVYVGDKFVIGEPKTSPICEIIKAKLPKKGQKKMFDLEAIEKRHAAGSPAAEDYGDLIAEVKRLQSAKPAPLVHRKADPKPPEPTEENTKP